MGRKDIAVALLLALSGPAASEEPVGTGFPVRGIDQEFKKFIRDFGKTYDKLEHEVRRAVFEENLRFVEAENRKGHSYVLGVTEFADMTPDEFALTHLGLRSPRHPWGDLPRLGTHLRGNSSLPAAVDWREKGAVTPVKNQAQCGSCWAFSTTGSLEGAWQLASGKLASMSEQQLVDCSKRYGNDGCSGGLMDNAFKYAERNALCTEESYPYKAKASVCKAKSCTVAMPAGSVKGFKDVKADDEDALKDAVAQQPVSIAIEADKQVFQLYKSGVLSGACGSSLDHGVLVVGYGKANGKNTWIVKNSWGPSWGMDGYALLLRGKSGPGECGLAKQASYPVVKAGPPGPSPGPTPGPVPPPAPSAPHYEKPPCRSDEVEASVEGAGGDLCAPSCDSSACPMDVPPGTKAKPQCILQDSSSGSKYCALVCMRKSGCPEGATCAKLAGFIGVCVYPETRNGTLHAPKHLSVVGSSDIVV